MNAKDTSDNNFIPYFNETYGIAINIKGILNKHKRFTYHKCTHMRVKKIIKNNS